MGGPCRSLTERSPTFLDTSSESSTSFGDPDLVTVEMDTGKMRSWGGVDMSPLIRAQELRLHLALLASLCRTPLAGQVLEQTRACEGVRGHAGVDMCICRTVRGGLLGSP